MEAKDLILLTLTPILLVGIIFYISSQPITGAATAAKDEEKIIGAYSIVPSFRTSIGYNIEDEYKNAKSSVKKIIEECASSENMENCVRVKASEKGMLCVDQDETTSILTEFIDKFNECIGLGEEKIVCNFELEPRRYINTQKSIRNFKIALTNWYSRTKAEMSEDDKVIATRHINLDNLLAVLIVKDFNDRDSQSKKLSSVTIDLNYRDGIPAIEKMIALTEDSKQLGLSNLFIFYKSEVPKFIEKAYQPLFLAPQPANKIINLPIKRGIKFCIKSDKKAMAYDSADKTVKPRDIIYKFAITFPRAVPAPIEKLEAYDAKKSENSAILVWSNQKEKDATGFSIYYSKKEFIDMKMDEIKSDDDIKKITVQSDAFAEIEDISINECDFEKLGMPCKYLLYNAPLEKDKLYYWKKQDKFIYLVKDLEDDVEYNFAVTAVNEEGELSNDKSKPNNKYVLTSGKNYAKFSPVDDLAPGKVENLKAEFTDKIKLTWKKPLVNADDTTNKDLTGFNIHYNELISDIPPHFETYKKQVTLQEAKCENQVLECEYFIEGLSSTYKFSVVAFDEKQNKIDFDVDAVPVK